jgi:dihydroorotase
MHEGEVSRQLGIPGIPPEAEEISIARDILLARLSGGWLHVLHVSTGYGAKLVQAAKADGIRVTAEVMPHHLTMSDRWIAGDRTLHNTHEPPGKPGTPGDPDTKVNPPLRPVSDTEALLAALKAGTFDIIATDHAPHAASEKAERTFEQAMFGLSGLELALPTMLALVRAGHLSLATMIDKLSTAPAKLLRRPLGTLAPGGIADIFVFDPDERWTVTPETLMTKSHNTPLLGMELQGRTKLTLVGGEERFRA